MLSLSLSNTDTHSHTHITSSSGRRGILFNGIMLFLLLSAFPQTPCLPCQENNESIEPFVRATTQHFHLCCPPIPKKYPLLHSHLPSVISVLSRFQPSLPLPVDLPRVGQHLRATMFFLFSLHGLDVIKIIWGGWYRPWGGGKEVWSGRLNAGGRHYQLMLTWLLQAESDWCADCIYCLKCLSSQLEEGTTHPVSYFPYRNLQKCNISV